MPSPTKGEKQDAFISRCMGDKEANSSFPDEKERAAFCYKQWEGHANSACGCGPACKGDCHAQAAHVLRANLLSAEFRHTTFQGRSTFVVPVVMADSTVIMNDCMIPLEELGPQAWNGRPVTINHPIDRESFVTANRPDKVEKQVVGQLFNARVEGTKLKAEAWLDVQRVNAVAPRLISMIESGQNIDVSTGYFSTDLAEAGVLNGRSYSVVNRNIEPDHLALLPNELGACSWADGCGVRSNARKTDMPDKPNLGLIQAAIDHLKLWGGEQLATPTKLNAAALSQQLAELHSHARSGNDHPVQQAADLVSNDKSPFLADDMSALHQLHRDTLATLHQDYCAPTGDGKMKGNHAAGLPQTQEELQALVDKAIAAHAEKQTASLGTVISTAVQAAFEKAFTPEVQAGIEQATKLQANARQEQVDRIVGNTSMTKEQAEKLDPQTLALLAASVLPQPSYAGRAAPAVNAADDPVVAAMVPPGVMETFNAMNGKKQGAH